MSLSVFVASVPAISSTLTTILSNGSAPMTPRSRSNAACFEAMNHLSWHHASRRRLRRRGWGVSSSSSSSSNIRMAQWDDYGVVMDYELRVEPVTSSFIEELLEPFEPHRPIYDGDGDGDGDGDDDEGRGTTTKTRRKATLLDVGCGTGGSTLRARDVGFEVTAVDASPTMVGRLEERRDEYRADGGGVHVGADIECRVSDGQNLPATWTDRFDYAVSSFSVVFFDDAMRGAEEIRRCLVPGGRAAVSAWGDRSDSPAFRIIADAMREVAPELVAGGEDATTTTRKRPVPPSSQGELTALLVGAGFVNVHVKGPVYRTLVVPTPEEYFDRFAMRSPPTLAMISWIKENKAEGCVDKFRERVIELAVERGGGRPKGPVEIISPAYFAYGTKPPLVD